MVVTTSIRGLQVPALGAGAGELTQFAPEVFTDEGMSHEGLAAARLAICEALIDRTELYRCDETFAVIPQIARDNYLDAFLDASRTEGPNDLKRAYELAQTELDRIGGAYVAQKPAAYVLLPTDNKINTTFWTVRGETSGLSPSQTAGLTIARLLKDVRCREKCPDQDENLPRIASRLRPRPPIRVIA
jgi:hypothetical protein